MIMAPGVAQELSSIITVEDGYKEENKGEFMLTAVSTQRATYWIIYILRSANPLV